MDEIQVPQEKTKSAKKPKAPSRRASDKSTGRAGGIIGGFVAAVFNLLTLLFVLLACVSGLAVAAVFNGALAFVPGGSRYIPPTIQAVAVVTVTPMAIGGTAGAIFPTLPPAWTQTGTPTISPTPLPGTPTLAPSATQPFPSKTPTATRTPTRTATRPSPTPTGPTAKPTITRSPFAYNLQTGSPTYLANFVNTSGCAWFGIVGRAFGLDNNPVINLTVHLEGGGINTDILTGTGPSVLGPGGYQIPISDHPVDTTDVYHIQLRNNSGTPLSDTYSIRTFGDCAKNAVMVNFSQNH